MPEIRKHDILPLSLHSTSMWLLESNSFLHDGKMWVNSIHYNQMHMPVKIGNKDPSDVEVFMTCCPAHLAYVVLILGTRVLCDEYLPISNPMNDNY